MLVLLSLFIYNITKSEKIEVEIQHIIDYR